MAENLNDKIAKLQEKQKQLKAQEKALKARQIQTERKIRTKRLIEVGAVVESVLGRPIEKEDLPNLLMFLQQQEQRGNFFSKAMQRVSKTDVD
jgi:hypothetical protein